MKEKLTAKDIRKAVKELEKHKVKPDGDGLITVEIENPRELTDFLVDKNYLKLEKMIKKAKKNFTHYIYADNGETIGKMCNLQGYCEAYLDLGLITKEQFYKLDELI